MFVCTYICMSNYTQLCNRLHLIKNCLCCFLDMLLCSNNLSTTAKNSLLIKAKVFPACFSRSKNFILLQSLSESEAKKIVFQKPAAETNELCDLGYFYKRSITSGFFTRTSYIKIHFLCKIIQ